MPWMLIAAWFAAGTISSFTDWLFMGVLFHDRYNHYPEVWWPGIREGEKRAILWSVALGYLGVAALFGLFVFSGVHDMSSALKLAILAWIAGPLVIVVTNNLFIKLDPLISVAHAVGYLARFLIAAVAFALLG